MLYFDIIRNNNDNNTTIIECRLRSITHIQYYSLFATAVGSQLVFYTTIF